MRNPSPAALRLPLSALCLLFTFAAAAPAQTSGPLAALRPVAQADRIPQQPDLAPQVRLSGHLPAWVTPANQNAARSVDLSAPLRFTVLLRRDPAVQAAFEQLLDAQQQRSSPLYHQWLTQEQIGALYGPTTSDVAAVAAWLGAQGLRVDSIAPSRLMIEVSGSTAAVAAAFRTGFAYYDLAGTPRLSASTEPSVPLAFAPVLDSLHGLTEIPLEPQVHTSIQPVPQTNGALTPQLTAGNPVKHYLSPGDVDIIYDINAVYNNSDTGASIGSTPQHIAIIGRSRVATSDITTFESKTGLPNVLPNVVIPGNGTDPGTTNTGDQDEATLDVDRVIGTAYGAVPDLVVSSSSNTYDGVYIAAAWNVNSLKDPIMTISFGACEANAGINGVNLWNSLFSSAAAAGISVFVSSDDSDAAGCATAFSAPPSTTPVASINYICSSSFATCVGGTEFNDTTNTANYWNSTNGSNLVSAIRYIPEGAWNEPLNSSSAYQIAGTGGGASNYIGKPNWQTGTGVPADGKRDVPDVALSASAHNAYYACLAYAGADCSTYFVGFSGTSASAPGMAGIAALLNTRLGAAQGNLNPLLYQLATSYPAAFHDATPASSGVTGCSTASASMCNNSTPGPSSLTGGLAGYALTTGYDQATGLGSVDVAALLNDAVILNSPAFTLTPASTSLTIASGATTGNTDTITVAATAGFSGTANLTCTVTSVSGNANGTCSLTPNSVTLNSTTTSTTSTLKILTNAATYGTLSVTVTGTSGNTVITSPAIQVMVTGPYFTAVPTPNNLTVVTSSATPANNTTTVQLTSYAGFSGTVYLACYISSATLTGGTASCAPATTSVVLNSGGTASVPFTVTDAIGGSGSTTLQLSASGIPSGGSSSYASNNSVPVTFVAPGITVTPTTSSISFTSGATTGNSQLVTIASTNGFNGTVTVGCSISGSSAFYPPSCTPGATSVAVSPSVTASVPITINSTTAVSAANKTLVQAGFGIFGHWRLRLAAVLAVMLCLLPLRRRRGRIGSLGVFLLLAAALQLTACSSSSTPATSTPVIHSSAGTYTVTVTASGTTSGGSTAVSVSNTFTVTIN